MELICESSGQDNTTLDMHVSNLCPPKFHVYDCFSWPENQLPKKLHYSKLSTDASSCLSRRTNALTIISGPISTASPKMDVFGTRSSYKPVACNLGKFEILPNDMHCTSSVLYCLENTQMPLGSLRRVFSHPHLATSRAKETRLMSRKKENDCAD